MKTTFHSSLSGPRSSGWLRRAGLAAALILAGCSQQPSPENPAEVKDPGKVIIRGSNTVGEELAPQLIAAFKQEHPSAKFDLESKGTAYGLGALMGGYCDIAGASRLPSKEELEVARYRSVELNDHVIGAYGVAVVVNAGNAVTNLTKEQVRDIFTGVIQNWKEAGGLDAPIHLYSRDPVSGTHLGFKELAMENQPYAAQQNLFTNYEGIVKALAADPDGIGYASLELEKNSGIKPVTIGGVAASFENVNTGKYPYFRTLHLYTGKGRETPATLEFIQFVLSPQGQAALTRAGYVPLP
jgi:phosphate transport system substrate-binding protein